MLHDFRLRLEHDWYGRQAKRQYRSRFAEVRRFCLFVGYPRSGHSLVGAMLNAHPDVVIAHEANAPRLVDRGLDRDSLFASLIARAEIFHRQGNESNYRYAIPNQWQGRFSSLQVLGDKRGGAVTRRLDGHPGFLAEVRDRVGVPLRLIHVVRHPLDNISAISLWHRLSLDESIEFYSMHCRITAQLAGWCEEDELVTVRHEEFFSTPEQVLRKLCFHLGVEVDANYLQDCAGITLAAPTRTRERVAWTSERVARVAALASGHPDLGGYSFDESV